MLDKSHRHETVLRITDSLSFKSTLSLVDVRIIDHFVVAGDQVVSFAERGLI